jgi:amino acid transporter
MPKSGKFGTFGGVFTPSILTILGVIMYLRLGWVVGNAGALTSVILIIMMAHIVSITTGLSVSSIATDKKIKAGGIYYMLSRSLGFPIGGAIGLTLFVATALSIALYLIGFGESALLVLKEPLGIEAISINHLRVVGSLALMMIVTIAFISTSIAIKTQYFILGAIVLSLVSILFGTTEGKNFDFSEVAPSGVSFSTIFGIFFPAVTGFTAGVAMSGDLRDPKKSIPWGTILAVATGLIVYVGLSMFIFYAIPAAELRNNNNVLVEFGWIPQFVIAGIWGATLSSALGGILGAPRILQAMSLDRITPHIFGRGVGKENEPRNALILTFILAEAGILIGELDVIAEIVAMFYLAAYMFINLSAFLEQWASPDFRPTFKISIFIPLIGAIATFLLMIQLNLAATIASIFIILIIFLWLTRKQLELGSGDVWQSVWSSIVKFGLKNLNKGGVHKRNWEPNILLFSGGTQARPHLLEFSTSIAGRNGMISNFDLIEDKTAKVLFPKQQQSILGEDLSDNSIFYRRKTCSDIFDGIETIASTYGFSGVEPNTVLMGWARNSEHPIRFSKMTNILHQLDYNVLFLDYDKKRGFGQKQRIDIWWRDLSQISYFTVQLVKLMNASPDWTNADVRFLYYDNENNDKAVLENEMRKRVSELRKTVEIKVVNNQLEEKPFYEVVKANSFEADLIIMDLPDLGKREMKDFVQKTNELLDILGTTLIVKASSNFYEESVFNSTLEKKYASKSTATIEDNGKAGNEILLGTCQFELLDQEIGKLDLHLHQLNKQFGNDIYTNYAEVLETCTALWKEEAKNGTNGNGQEDVFDIMTMYKKTAMLIEDVKENRLGKVSNKLFTSINTQFGALEKFIDRLPQKVIRPYTVDELSLKFEDLEGVQRFKKSVKRSLLSPKSNINLKKISREHLQRAYLIHFEQVLHSFGGSTLLFNTIIKKWVGTIGNVTTAAEMAEKIGQLQSQIEEALSKEKSRFVEELNLLGRQYCNTIIKDVDKLNNQSLLQLDSKKYRAAITKRKRTNIAQYPQVWQQNTVFLNNQLLLNIHLQELKKSIWPIVLQVKEDLVEQVLTPSLKLFTNIHRNLNKLTETTIEDHENKLIEAGAVLNIDEGIKDLMQKIDKLVAQYCSETEIIPPVQLDQFESTQMEIIAENIDVKKVSEYLIDNEIILSLKSALQADFNEIKSELLVIENALRLLKYSLSSSRSENIALLEEVKARVSNQFKDSKQQLKNIDKRLDQEIKDTASQLNSLLRDEIIINRANQMNGIIRKDRARRGFNRYASSAGHFIENANNQVDGWIIKLRDLWNISDHQYRIKSLQNPHTRLANFIDKIALSPELEKEIPFFYNQLFTGKHSAPLKPAANRETELAAAEKAINRFNSGSNGAILFTGEPLSGLTYLLENVTNSLIHKKVIHLKPPSRHNRKPEKLINEGLVFSTGMHLDTDAILGKLPQGTVLIFEDLELWWTRREGGADFINYINKLISQFGHRILFMVSCNIYFYQHIRQYINLDGNLLDTILINPLSTQELKRVILIRHHSGGMTYFWKNKPEKNLRIREQNKLFKRITSASEGNIGTALHLWLGNVMETEENKLFLGPVEMGGLPPVLSSEWETMLLQFLLHKQLTLRRLCTVYGNQEEHITQNILNSLLRTNMLIETSSKTIKINPFVLPYLIRYFRRKQFV